MKKTKKKQISKKNNHWFPLVLLIALLGGIYFGVRAFTMNSPQEEETIPEENLPMEERVASYVHVFEPQPDEFIEFPLTIRGEAKPEWFDEGRFPIRVLSEIGTVLANGVAESRGQESSSGYIGFEAVMEEFDTEQWEYGTIMLLKSDPFQFSSKEQLVFPVKFVE